MHSLTEQERERLREAMRKLAEQTARLEPPREIADAVLLHFVEAPPQRRRWWHRAAIGVAAAAAIAVALWPSAAPPVVPPADTPRFIALPYVIQPAENEPTRVVRTQVLAAELIAVGLPLDGDPNAQFEAEVLVGQDGRARAVRLIEEFE